MKKRKVDKKFIQSIEQRINNLISQMTLDEKIGQLDHASGAIERLNVPAGKYGGECLHGLCHTGRATQFPMPIGMAATFNEKLIYNVASAIADEARAKFHDPEWANENYSLLFWTPVINILRDPRWGRAQETYGEDPVLTSKLGSAFVRGAQGDNPKYLKIATCAKHLGVHSGPENLRRKFNAIVSKKDMMETYLPAFGSLVESGVATIMATYNRVNGEHSCASKTMIDDFLRKECGFEGMVLSDGGALESLHTSHGMTKDAVETAGLCLKNGCDFELGKFAYPYLKDAIKRNLVTEKDVNTALSRILKVRFLLGEFDSLEDNPYSKIRKDVIQCKKHINLARKTAVQSIVLLKNNGVLPITDKKQRLHVTGPNAADIQLLLGNFYRGVSGDLRTILEGIVSAAPEGTTVTHMQGCLLAHENIYPSHWAIDLSDGSNAIIAVMGYTPLMEGEQGECIAAPDGGDKNNISISKHQIEFLRALSKKPMPLITIVTGGSPIELEEIHNLSDAVIMAWYPGEQGGMAVGDILFGKESPSGKLPATFPKSLDQVPPYTDYNMKNRTYRYMEEEPMYPFGFGLSYTTFKYSKLAISKESIEKGENIKVSVNIKNTGDVKSDEVVQLYLTDEEASVPVPKCALKDFKRITLQPNQEKSVKFMITSDMMKIYTMNGEKILESGSFTIHIGGTSPSKRSEDLGSSTIKTQFKVM